jgi:hypothetical protein
MNERPNPDNFPVYQFSILKVHNKLFSSKVELEIDFGTDDNLLRSYNQSVISDSQQVVNYKHLVDALNYLAKLGWEVVSVHYREVSGSTDNSPQYLLKRRVNV